MKRPSLVSIGTGIALMLLVAVATVTLAAEKMPADKAGEIGTPTGRIAFIREGSVWVMEANGNNQQMISETVNAAGRLSWSSDNKEIAFTRTGNVQVQLPDHGGGYHRLNDLYLLFLDSAYANNMTFWYSLTGNMGSRGPEFSSDGKSILFWKDLNADLISAAEPDYRMCTMDTRGGNVKLLRRDDRPGTDSFLVSPSMNANGDLACTALFDKKMKGLVILKKDQINMPMDSVAKVALKKRECVSPVWSPDGKWLAYILNKLDSGGLYIATADLKEEYLVFEPSAGTNLYTVAPSFSPDSKWLTFSTNDGSIWICDIAGKAAQRLTGPGGDQFPAWSR